MSTDDEFKSLIVSNCNSFDSAATADLDPLVNRIGDSDLEGVPDTYPFHV